MLWGVPRSAEDSVAPTHQLSDNKKTMHKRESRWADIIDGGLKELFDAMKEPGLARHNGLVKFLCKKESREVMLEAVERSGIKSDIAVEFVLVMEQQWNVSLGCCLQDILIL